jgi:drug/metabolite transporter (DMT)-like permease
MSRRASLLALHLAVALFGFAGLFGKWLSFHPSAIVLGRATVAAIVLAVVLRAQHVGRIRPTWDLAANGAILAVHWVAFFAAIQVSTVAIGLLGFASFPLFVLGLERAMLGRRWHATEAATAVLVASGLALLVPSMDFADRTLKGLAWGILSGFTFALLAVRNRGLSSRHPASVLALWQNAFAALCLVPVVLWQGGAGSPVTADAIVLVLLLGVLCTALAHTLFIASMVRLSAHTASVVAALEPVYGIVLAAALLGEIPDVRTCVGAALIVGAAIVASRRTDTSR